MNWDLATDVILYTSIAMLAVFAVLGLVQLIQRKSIKKVDKTLLFMLVPLVLMVITYFLFDHVFVWNTRPDGSGEPSFPSTHVMVVATIFFIATLALPKYIKSKSILSVLYILMLALLVIVSIGRIIANKHWLSDVLGGLGFAIIFAVIYYFITRKKHA